MISRIGLLALLAVTRISVADSPPNIVLIISDNQSQSLLGTYGNAGILTPNIDQLAAEGIQFNRAFSVNGVCSPTRATLMTGLLPSQTGVHVALPTNVDVADWSAIEEFRNLPQTLKKAGYNTALVGKYHLGRMRNRSSDSTSGLRSRVATRPRFTTKLLSTTAEPIAVPNT